MLNSNFRPARRDIPKYKEDVNEIKSDDQNNKENIERMDKNDDTISKEFSHKTEQLLDFIEKNYLTGKWSLDKRGKHIINKMKLAENSSKVF